MSESGIIELEDKKVLMWAEQGSTPQGYRLFILGSRYGRMDEIKIPEHVVKRIKEKASDSYPILIVDGYGLDLLFDKVALGETRRIVYRSFGDFPRKATGEDKRDSVEEFFKGINPANCSGKKVNLLK